MRIYIFNGCIRCTNPEYTSCCILVDKEEIGSVGATGAQSLFFENAILDILALQGYTTLKDLRTTLANTKMLSSDVSAGFDPLFANVNDPKNAAYLGRGIVFNKYTGSRGKSGSNDANPEYVAWVRNVMDKIIFISKLLNLERLIKVGEVQLPIFWAIII